MNSECLVTCGLFVLCVGLIQALHLQATIFDAPARSHRFVRVGPGNKRSVMNSECLVTRGLFVLCVGLIVCVAFAEPKYLGRLLKTQAQPRDATPSE
jgi:hypothetical protein